MATIPLPSEKDVLKLSDWMEVNAAIDDDNSCSIEDLASLLKLSNTNEYVNKRRIGVSAELHNRMNLLKEVYPFNFNGQLLEVKNAKNFNLQWTYLFCLMISYVGVYNGSTKMGIWKKEDVTRIFEELCQKSAEKYLCGILDESKGIRFGAPRSSWAEKNRGFKRALDVLRSGIKEGGILNNPKSSKRKDAGLDVVAWREFPDKRLSKLLFLGQCAAGREFQDKTTEISEFNKYYTIRTSGRINGFFIPHVIDDAEWLDLTYGDYVDVLFDRNRISYYSKDWDGKYLKKILKRIQKKLKSVTIQL